MEIKYKTIFFGILCAFSLGFLWHFMKNEEVPLILINRQGVFFSPHLLSMLKEARLFLERYASPIISVYIIVIAFLIFLEGRNPDRTILWLLTLAFLPGVGLLLYLFLGPDLRRLDNRKRFRNAALSSCPKKFGRQENKNIAEKLQHLLENSSGAPLLKYNTVELLIDGTQTFPRLWEALRAASDYILIEYFIIKNDAMGRQLADILCERAQAGVRVFLLYDDVGCWHLGRGYINRLKEAGVQVRDFLPASFPFFRSRMNFRNHRKIVVIDGKVAFSGGLNIGLEYMGKGPLGYWRDTHALFTGEAVGAFQRIFINDWNTCKGVSLDPEIEKFILPEKILDHAGRLPLLPLQIAFSGSDSAWHTISQAYMTLVANAQKKIWITTPYLVPGIGILSALRIAALSGVDVRILIPSVADHYLVFWAGRSNIEDLLRAGVRIWMYLDGFVHAKTLLMDHSIASVGTANMDTRSLEINFEVQAFMYDESLNRELASQFLEDCAHSEECCLADWVKRPLIHRIFESIGKLWSAQI